ncbi:hypothetical protein TNCV_812511 [Trichonephila clavipes]|nr:hypothetical protein TNCV_812511 [Trichonephila clavipes]
MEVAGRKVRAVWLMVQYFPFELFEYCFGYERCVRPSVVLKQADSIFQHSPGFVLNCPSKTLQSLAICSSINCRSGRHKFQQKNALSVPKKIKFAEIKFLHSLAFGEFEWRHCIDCCLDSGIWL